MPERLKEAPGTADSCEVTISGPTKAPVNPANSWLGRPALAATIRITVYLTPVVAAFSVVAVLSAHLPPAKLGVSPWLWALGTLPLSVLVTIGVERNVRHLLPLAALFRLTLVFPDKAPSRFGVALRTGTTRRLERRIREIRAEGIESDDTTHAEKMLELVAAVSVHDRLTRGHCERVRAYTDMLIEELDIAPADASKLRWAALLHDVGKIMVPVEVLTKNGRPNEEEWEVLKSHTWEGARLIEPLKPWLGEWAATVGSHHERWDGGGYPLGQTGDEIHLGARIVAVVDAFDVMTSHRSYKKPMPAAAARAEIARCAGSQFDPDVARAFLNISLGRLQFAAGPLSWLASLSLVGRSAPLIPAAASGVVAVAAITTGALSVQPPATTPSALEAPSRLEVDVGPSQTDDDDPPSPEPGEQPSTTSGPTVDVSTTSTIGQIEATTSTTTPSPANNEDSTTDTTGDERSNLAEQGIDDVVESIETVTGALETVTDSIGTMTESIETSVTSALETDTPAQPIGELVEVTTTTQPLSTCLELLGC